MNFRLVEKEAFNIIGKPQNISCADGKHHELIPRFWDESYSNGLCKRLSKLSGNINLIGVCMDFNPEKEELAYLIAAEKEKAKVNQSEVQSGFSEAELSAADLTQVEVPAATWAVFESEGQLPGAIQKVWEYIFAEWFPAAGYSHANAPDLEVYPPGDTTASDYRCEVWIPVIKK